MVRIASVAVRQKEPSKLTEVRLAGGGGQELKTGIYVAPIFVP